MRRMTNVWPCAGDDGIDRATPRRDFQVSDGDLLVMTGDTQKHWHHRVPKARSRRPRVNINFRYIIEDSPDACRGQQTYYRYMVHGDAGMPPSAAGGGAARARSHCRFKNRDRDTKSLSESGIKWMNGCCTER
jgi:hypothetical protein